MDKTVCNKSEWIAGAPEIRSLFPFFKNNPDLTYLDSAATSQKLKGVIEKGYEFYSIYNAPVSRSAYELAYRDTEEFEKTREEIASLIGADCEEVAFTSSATAAFNILANSLGYVEDPRSPLYLAEGDEILLSRSEHNSVLLPLQELARRRGCTLKFLPMSEDGQVEGWKEAIGEKTKIVAVSRLSNVTGAFADIPSISKAAHAAGAIVISDICQAVAHEKIEVKALGIDFTGFSAHKIYGPTGLGFLYGRKDLFDQLPASYFGGSMVDSAWENRQAVYKSAPWRFEAGTQPVAQVIAMQATFDFLKKGISETALTERLMQASSIPHVRILGPLSPAHRAPILSFEVEGVHPHDVAQFMAVNGVAIRSGHQCAQILHRSFGIPSSSRASLAPYNEPEEVDRFLDLLSGLRSYFIKGE
ncbi:MAG: aminotransferase class V-fold PLP-dependent enzyme [Aeriscardovia sp.]|nr:aminotransferase class V-fold PLP-dependent enzyme [Aeriscardovia sp.]